MRPSRVARAFLGVALAALVTGTGLVAPPAASAAVSPASMTQLKARSIYYLRTGNDARRQLVLDAMATRSAREGALWSDFLASWETINAGMPMNRSTPSGLPKKGHAFVVLGSALSSSGKATTKLVRRLKLALAAAEKYPHSLVLVSGGAPRNGHTEAGVMSSWLRARGVAASRILVEKASASTVGNAANSMAMLARRSSITSYSLISDSSHLRRASVLFRAATVRVQEQTGKAWGIRQLANVAFPDMASAGLTQLSSSSVAYTAGNVASVLKVLDAYRAVEADPPAAPVLTSVEVTTPAKLSYAVGEKLEAGGLVVTAVYNRGVYARVVTGHATVTGFDTRRVGAGRATASYTEGRVTRTAGFAYTVVKAASSQAVTLSTRTVRKNSTRVGVAVKVSAPNGLVPSGVVRYYLDGKRLKTLRLDAGAGSLSFRYPRIAATGSHSIVVKYSGDDQLTAARTATTVTVKD